MCICFVWASSWYLIKKKKHFILREQTNNQTAIISLEPIILLGTFAKLIKATINVVISGCLSIRPFIRNKQLGPQWENFHVI